MNKFYTCKYFFPYELVDKKTYAEFGVNVWFLFRQDALISLDRIRQYFGVPVIVNNWHEGGSLQSRGFRPYNESIGAKYSQHRLGNAFDLDVAGITPDKVRETIIDNKDDSHFELITCLEIDVGWLHFDCRNISERILLIKP